MTYLLTYSYEGQLTSDTKKAVDFKSMVDLSRQQKNEYILKPCEVNPECEL